MNKWRDCSEGRELWGTKLWILCYSSKHQSCTARLDLRWVLFFKRVRTSLLWTWMAEQQGHGMKAGLEKRGKNETPNEKLARSSWVSKVFAILCQSELGVKVTSKLIILSRNTLLILINRVLSRGNWCHLKIQSLQIRKKVKKGCWTSS